MREMDTIVFYWLDKLFTHLINIQLRCFVPSHQSLCLLLYWYSLMHCTLTAERPLKTVWMVWLDCSYLVRICPISSSSHKTFFLAAVSRSTSNGQVVLMLAGTAMHSTTYAAFKTESLQLHVVLLISNLSWWFLESRNAPCPNIYDPHCSKLSSNLWLRSK